MPTAVGKHRSGRSARAGGRTWAAGSGRWARGWGCSGGCRRELTRATDFFGLFQRGQDGRTATVYCGCGARAIRGSWLCRTHHSDYDQGGQKPLFGQLTQSRESSDRWVATAGREGPRVTHLVSKPRAIYYVGVCTSSSVASRAVSAARRMRCSGSYGGTRGEARPPPLRVGREPEF